MGKGRFLARAARSPLRGTAVALSIFLAVGIVVGYTDVVDRYFAGVAVKPNKGCLGPARHEPPMELDTVGGLKENVLEIESPVAGELKDHALGEET